MDLIPVVDNQEYLLCDRNLIIIQFSAGVQKYAEQPIAIGEDIRVGNNLLQLAKILESAFLKLLA